MIRQFTKYGYSTIAQSVAIGTSYTVVPLTGVATNKKSANVPDDCHLESSELELSDIAASDTITIFLARDSAGKVPVTTDQAADATQTVTMSVAGGATTGGVSYTIKKDYHFDTTVANTTSGTLYLCVKANAACQTPNIQLNWRS